MTLKLARYEVLGRLASGGMGDVWLARASGPAGFEKLVVIKTVRPEADSRPDAVEMFQREARVAAMLSHANCVQVFELGEEDGTYFIAMEYLDGFSLLRVLRRADELSRRPPPEIVARIAMDAAAGLYYAHTLSDRAGQPLGLVHRDVSPDNIIVTFDGQTKIVDFGIAKATSALLGEHTATGVIKGKAAYMAPEYLRGEAIDARVDVFALGVVLFRALAGERPFIGDDAQIVAAVLACKEPPSLRAKRPELPEALDAVVARALAPDREQRFQTARELRVALAEAIGKPAETDEVAAYMASLWREDDGDRAAVRKLAAGLATGTQPALPRETRATPGGRGDEARTTPGGRSTEALTTPIGSDTTHAASRTHAVTAPATPAPRRRRGRALAGGGLALALGAGAIVLATRSHHDAAPAREPAVATAPAVLPRGTPEAPVGIVIADFANTTGEPVFDDTLEKLLELSFDSPTVVMYSREAGTSDRVDVTAARAIAQREHMALVLAGTITKSGGAYHVALRLLDAASGRELGSIEATADTGDHLVGAAEDAAAALTRRLDSRDEPAEPVRLTTSLAAMHELAACFREEKRGNLDAMLARAQQAIALDHDFALAYSTLAITFQNRGRIQDADRNYEAALSKIDHLPTVLRLNTRGMYYLDHGDLDHSADELQQEVQRFPSRVNAVNNLSLVYCFRRQIAKSIELEKQIVERTHGFIANMNLGIYRLYNNEPEQAIVQLQPLLSDERGFSKAAQVLALAELVLGHVDRATAQWNALAARDAPSRSDAQLGLADLALYEGRVDDAIGLLAQGAQVDTAAHNSDGAALKLVTLAHAYSRVGRAREAKQALADALGRSKDAGVALWAARTYADLGDVAHAKAIGEELGARLGQQRKVDSLVIAAEVDLASHRARDAVDKLEQAQGIIDTWLGRLDLARAYNALAAYAQASSEIDVLLKRYGEGAAALLDEDATGYLLPEVYYEQGRALEGLGNARAAGDAYERVLAMMRARPTRDPTAVDAARRLTALRSATGSDPASRPTPARR